ncbi:hypothetical protein EVA_17325 [gut metagenome]|uniref:Uncharacterized protein n=1 Tax=gut metagenome TaxID=749906 RepID=J9FI68_9ZZZZ
MTVLSVKRALLLSSLKMKSRLASSSTELLLSAPTL